MVIKKSRSNINLIYIAKIIITLIILVLLIWFIISNKDVIEKIKSVRIIYFIPLIVLSLIDLILTGYFLKTIVKPFNIDLNENFFVAAASNFLNQIIPIRGGDGMRALYLKQKYELSYYNYISTIFGYLVITFFYLSILILSTLLILYLVEGFYNTSINLLFIIIFICSTFIIIKPMKFKNENFFTKKINYSISGWKRILDNKKILMMLITISALIAMNMILKNYIGFMSLDINLSFIRVIFIYIMIKLVAFINITPGGLGFTEAAYMFSGYIFNIEPENMFALAIILRGINIMVIIPTGLISYLYLINKYNYNPKKKFFAQKI